MGETFTRASIRVKHTQKIQAIIDLGGGVEEIANYLMADFDGHQL